EQLGHIDLDAHPRAEPCPGVPVGQLGVSAGEAVDAAVKATLVGVEGPVEAHVLHAVERRLGDDLEVLGPWHGWVPNHRTNIWSIERDLSIMDTAAMNILVCVKQSPDPTEPRKLD